MFKHGKVKNYLVIITSILFCCVYSASFITPSKNLVFYFIANAIPIVLVLQIIGSVILFKIRPNKIAIIIWFMSLLPAFYFIPCTIGVAKYFSENKQEKFSLLTFNVSNFSNKKTTKKVHEMDSEQDAIAHQELIRQLSLASADIICLQEFYYCPSSTIYNSIDLFIKKYPYYSFSVDTIKNNQSLFGLAIFSKYPIVGRGEIFVSSNSFNRACYSDIVIGIDTVKIINVHFQSNQIKKNNTLSSNGLHDFENESMTVFSKIKKNMSKRLSQAESVLACVSKTKIPVIVAGDFNETPYGYIYNEFRNTMKNSFQTKGTGFGFTMNNNTLFFLRIDQQFYSQKVVCTNHSVVKDFAMSDHYPLLAGYTLE